MLTPPPAAWNASLQVLRLLSAQGIAPRSRSTPVTTTTTVAATAADGSSANSPSAATASTSSGAADGLIRDVRGATDADAAARVLQAAQQAVAAGSLDPAAAVCLLAALAKAPPAVASSPQLRPLSQAISLLLLEQLDALGAADRSAAVAAFGRLGGWRPTVLLQQVVRAAVADPDAYAPLDAIWLVWGLAKANYKTLQVKALLKRVLARAVSAASRDDDPWARLSVKDLAALMWACGRVGYSSGALLADLTARVMVALPMPPPPAAAEVSAAAGAASAGAAAAPGGAWPKLQWFSNMAWAAGRLKYCNASYLGWVCAWAAAVAPAEPPQPQAISNLAWALCELGKCLICLAFYSFGCSFTLSCFRSVSAAVLLLSQDRCPHCFCSHRLCSV